MIDPIGAVAAATASIDQSLKLIRRVSTAIEIHKNGRKDLEFIFDDLSNIAQVIELVQTSEEIRTKGVLKALANILKHAEKLDDHVQQVRKKSSTGSSFRRAAHHFMTGPEDLEHTNRVVNELASLKTTLILHIQVAHVGLVVQNDQDKRANPGCTHMLDSSVLHEVNQVVEQRLGKGQGLKIAEVLRGKSADDDGMIRLSQEEYECLVFHSLDDIQSNQELGTIRVANNQTFDQALQINGFISDDWMEFTQNLTIEDNEARNQSIQVNVPTGRQDFAALLAVRDKTLEMVPSSGWAPAPLMPKQTIRSLGDQTAEQCQEICGSANEQDTNQKLYTTSGILADGDSGHSVIKTPADLFDERKESVSYTGHILDETARKINADDSNKSGEVSMTRSLKPAAVSDTIFSEVYDPFCSDAEGSTHPSSLSYNFRDRDQEPDNRSTMTFFKYEKSKLQEDVGDLKDDIQSISSIPDEIGSRAESESDMSMFHHAAIKFLVNTLTSNHNLVALYKEVTQRTQQAKFIANHRRLLKQYFLKLREDGQEFSQKSAIEILRPRHLRTLISQEIWNLVVPRDREERRSIVSLIEQDTDQLVMLDRFLHENGPTPALDTINSTSDSFQSDSSDEDEFKETENTLTNLEAAREFFVSGRPFQIYQESLRQFLKPTPVLARVPRHSNTSSLNRISTHHVTTSTYGNLEQHFGATHGSLKANSVEAVQRMTNMATDNTEFNIETDIKVHDGTKQLSQVQESSSAAQLAPRSAARRGAVAIMARIYAKTLTLLSNIGWREEDIAPGYHRVRWRNRRGKWLYDDYIEHEAGALQALEGYLNSSPYVSAAESSLENSSGPAIVIPSSSRMNQFQGNTSGSAGVTDQNLRSSVIGRCSSSQQDPEKGKLTSNTLHVLCCMDQRKRAVVLHEEPITNITDDRQLFQALHNSYRKHRGRFKHYCSLRAIQSIHFMKFAYGGRQYIDVRCHREICEQGKPCICLPPPDLVRPVGSEYECSPVPSKFSPPIGPRLMKDLFTYPEYIEPDSELVLRQLPKWACGNLPIRRVEIKETWGIYYEEDWDWTKIWWILGLGFFPPSLLFGIFWGILKKDIQGAFSIASWWMTGAAIVIGIVGTTT